MTQIPTLLSVLQQADSTELYEYCLNRHPKAIAEELHGVPVELGQSLFEKMPIKQSAAIFKRLSVSSQPSYAASLPRPLLLSLITAMPHDARAQLFKTLPRPLAQELGSHLPVELWLDIANLVAYPPRSVGAFMTSAFVRLSIEQTAEQALAEVRHEAQHTEVIHYAYVLNGDNQVLGIVNLKELLLASATTLVGALMKPCFLQANADESAEGVARRLSKYGLIAMPIVDNSKKMLGILTYDDAIELLQTAQEEDIEKMMALSRYPQVQYLKTSIWQQFSARAFWLCTLALLSIVSVSILQGHNALLSQVFILSCYLPTITNTGGTSGSQAATVITRAIATEEITPKDFLKVFIREITTAFLLSLLLGIMGFCRVYWLTAPDILPASFSLLQVSFVIGLALAVQVIAGAAIGTILPLLAVLAGIDPALVANPALTTMVDLTGMMIYMAIAHAFLNI